MRRLSFAVLAAGLAVVVSFVLLQVSGSAPSQAAIVKETHVHDNYYHPAGTFLDPVVTNHTLAQAACQKAQPDAPCDTIIQTGDSVRWVAPAPLAQFNHTVTECTDGTFSVCGAGTAAINPIEDSGVRAQAGWPYQVQFNNQGVYYYRCEIHPSSMRGRVVVNFVSGAVGGTVDLISSDNEAPSASTGGDGVSWLIYGLAALLGTAAVAGTGVAVRQRLRN